MTTVDLVRELEPVAARLLDRHLQTAKEWFPHELVPWSQGRDFAAGEVVPEDELMPGPVRSALFVNLLTEDNLPYYSWEIWGTFGIDGPWGEWGRRWTAEEGRHSIVMRDWMTVTRAVDPIDLERGRMTQVSNGEAPQMTDAAHALCYVTLQELATRLSHFNTGKYLEGTAGKEIMKRVAADENLHYLFYRDAATAAFEVDPSTMVIALDEVVRTFAMPGTGIPDFVAHAKVIANAGIYDLAVHHDQILLPVVLRHWGVEQLEGLTPEAEEARERLLKHIARLGKVSAFLKGRREEAQATDRALVG